MKIFTITAIRTDEYEIHVDENEWTPERIAEWASVFWDAETPEDIARHVARTLMRADMIQDCFEGFGYLRLLRADGSAIRTIKWGHTEEVVYCPGILVTLLEFDDGYEYEVNEKNILPDK